MKPIISVEGLGKKYVLRHEGKTPYKSLREEIFHLPQKWLSHRGEEREEFWALKDVSFDIMPGDRVGIIGRNGAGKSTLLKLLSRITEPSAGRITMRGRVASLLEVGTGFHPELTGRENIYLNGAILGMSRAEVRHKFDEIVDFAGVEKFLDTPVKRYSSGMYVRLAFAVAAHLEPEILVVDEVLAVGDAEFQKKCLGKMEEVSKGEGRTVLFVSHNMSAVQQLCSRGMLLKDGYMELIDDNIKSLISAYMGYQNKMRGCWIETGEKNEYFKPIKMCLLDVHGNIIETSQRTDADIFLEMSFELYDDDELFDIGYTCITEGGIQLFWSYHTDRPRNEWPKLMRGNNTIRTQIPKNMLNGGIYNFYMLSGIHCQKWLYSPGAGPSVTLKIDGGYSNSPHWGNLTRGGVLAIQTKWDIVDELE